MLKKLISNSLRKIGYQISRIQTLDDKIMKGEFKWIQDFKIKTVIDVGANVGKFTILINKIINNAKVYSFEPISDCYEQLVKNTKRIDNVECFNIALGRESKETVINRNEFLPSSSFLEMEPLHKSVFPRTHNLAKEKVTITTLDKIHNEIDWAPKILLKIDVQGFELSVLKGANSSLNLIDIIIVETIFVELYKNQARFNDIYNFLVERNFSYCGNFNQFNDPESGHILWADAIFIKN